MWSRRRPVSLTDRAMGGGSGIRSLRKETTRDQHQDQIFRAEQVGLGDCANDLRAAYCGFSGGSMERPGLKALLADVLAGRIDVVVIYKIDRLTRSLADFARIVEVLEKHGASFVNVTQSFNTKTSMGRLMLHVLLSLRH